MDILTLKEEEIASLIKKYNETRDFFLLKYLEQKIKNKKQNKCKGKEFNFSFLERFLYDEIEFQKRKTSYLECFTETDNIIFPNTRKKIIQEKSRFDHKIITLKKYGNKRSIIEFIKSFFFINPLREIIPNFSYFYNLIIEKNNLINNNNKLSFSLEDEDEDEKLLRDYNYPKKYIIEEELIEPSITWEEIFLHDDVTNLFFLILQIALSLEIAQRKIEFTHYDLHLKNIIIRTCPLNYKTDKIIYEISGIKYKLPNTFIATIIDFELSFVKKDFDFGTYYLGFWFSSDNIDEAINRTIEEGIYGYQKSNFFDMKKFLDSLINVYINLEIKSRKIEKMLNYITEFLDNKNIYNYLESSKLYQGEYNNKIKSIGRKRNLFSEQFFDKFLDKSNLDFVDFLIEKTSIENISRKNIKLDPNPKEITKKIINDLDNILFHNEKEYFPLDEIVKNIDFIEDDILLPNIKKEELYKQLNYKFLKYFLDGLEQKLNFFYFQMLSYDLTREYKKSNFVFFMSFYSSIKIVINKYYIKIFNILKYYKLEKELRELLERFYIVINTYTQRMLYVAEDFGSKFMKEIFIKDINYWRDIFESKE